MAVYDYKAMDLDASGVHGTIVADTARQARDVLRERGLTVTDVREHARRAGRWLSAGPGSRGQGEVVAFVRDLATLLRAGIPLHSALQTLSEQHSRRFRAVVQELADQVAAGTALAEAMGRRPEYFDEMCTSIVTVGENTGSLDAALERLADFKEKAHRLRSKVTTALVYPAIVTVVGLSVMIFLMTYVVPTLIEPLRRSRRDLPELTRWVQAASDLLIGYWWALLAGAGGLVLAWRAVAATPRGRLLLDRLALRVPLTGELLRKENTSRAAVVLSALLRSGLPFIDAVRITRQTIRNRVFRRTLRDYEEAVAAGKDVAAPLTAGGVFRPMVVQMLAVGQESGELEHMLEQLADSYDRQVETATARLTAMLEPLLIVVLAILVGFIAFATILPILEASHVL